MLSKVSKDPVDSQIWSTFEGPLASRALTSFPGIPVVFDAIQAVIVSAWNGGRVFENVPTDAAP